jgi:hypothetical protein
MGEEVEIMARSISILGIPQTRQNVTQNRNKMEIRTRIERTSEKKCSLQQRYTVAQNGRQSNIITFINILHVIYYNSV